MTYFSIWPFFMIMALLLLILSLPVFNKIKPNISNINRVQTIDGLRGFLAYGVIFSHGQNYHRILANEQWAAGSPNPFYNIFGFVAVRLFFMITAYLFWSRLLDNQGKMEWIPFYIKRIFRIGPVYWFACLCVFIIVMKDTHWTLQVSWLDLGKQIGSWLSLAILPLPDINNRPLTVMILLIVVWTLQYEWRFYIILPFISWFARSKERALCFIIGSIGMIYMIPFFLSVSPLINQFFIFAYIFLMGMLCATLQKYSLTMPFNATFQSFFLVAMTIGSFIYINLYDGIYISTILLAIIFFGVISGCSIFGLLTLPASQRMGEVSYGIYLLQGIIFYWVYSMPSICHYALRSSIQFWCVMMLICILILFLAIFAHIIFEKPGIKFGYKLSSLWSLKKRTYTNKL